MTYLHLVLQRTLEQEGKSDTMVVSVAISLLLLLLSLMLWLISESHFSSPISIVRVVNLFELLIHPSYNIDN